VTAQSSGPQTADAPFSHGLPSQESSPLRKKTKNEAKSNVTWLKGIPRCVPHFPLLRKPFHKTLYANRIWHTYLAVVAKRPKETTLGQKTRVSLSATQLVCKFGKLLHKKYAIHL